MTRIRDNLAKGKIQGQNLHSNALVCRVQNLHEEDGDSDLRRALIDRLQSYVKHHFIRMVDAGKKKENLASDRSERLEKLCNALKNSRLNETDQPIVTALNEVTENMPKGALKYSSLENFMNRIKNRLANDDFQGQNLEQIN